ncbi:MAG: hypothetical protein IJT76_07680 [Clostridia bacterium]|nr:hypothetical protein [Clostridia bacterium]
MDRDFFRFLVGAQLMEDSGRRSAQRRYVLRVKSKKDGYETDMTVTAASLAAAKSRLPPDFVFVRLVRIE